MQSGDIDLISAQLRRLPAFAAPAGSWAPIEQRLQHAVPRPAHWFGSFGALAASVCTVGVALVWMSTRAPGRLTSGVGAAVTDIDQLMQHSQWLEATLQRLPERPALERASTAAVIDELQNRIQLLDAQLTYGSGLAADNSQQRSMWNERVRLLNSLVDVRYAEALRDSRLHVSPSGELL
jgi:hypothetical protein